MPYFLLKLNLVEVLFSAVNWATDPDWKQQFFVYHSSTLTDVLLPCIVLLFANRLIELRPEYKTCAPALAIHFKTGNRSMNRSINFINFSNSDVHSNRRQVFVPYDTIWEENILTRQNVIFLLRRVVTSEIDNMCHFNDIQLAHNLAKSNRLKLTGFCCFQNFKIFRKICALGMSINKWVLMTRTSVLCFPVGDASNVSSPNPPSLCAYTSAFC